MNGIHEYLMAYESQENRRLNDPKSYTKNTVKYQKIFPEPTYGRGVYPGFNALLRFEMNF